MRRLALFIFLAGCGPATRVETGGGTVRIPVPEKRCGENRETLFSAYSRADLEALADCTVLVGHFQQDSVSQLRDFAPLKNVPSRHVDFAFFVQNLPDGTPDFEQSIQLFDNGIVSQVNFEFGGLPVLGTLRKLELLPPQKCG